MAIGAQLGSGAYGAVHKCSFRGLEKCAVKLLTKNGTMNKTVSDAFMKEVKIMCSLSHPCTVRLYAWVERPPAMVMELAIGDLRHYYQDNAKGGLLFVVLLLCFVVTTTVGKRELIIFHDHRRLHLTRPPSSRQVWTVLSHLRAQDQPRRGQGHGLPPLCRPHPP